MTTPGSSPPPRQPGPNRASLLPTKIATLVVVAIAAGVLSWAGWSKFYGEIPDLNWLPGLTLAGLAIVEFVAAHNTRQRIERRPGRGPLNPLLVARYAVLAKASSIAGLIGALALVAGAIVLERACRVPPSKDDEDQGTGGGGPSQQRR